MTTMDGYARARSIAWWCECPGTHGSAWSASMAVRSARSWMLRQRPHSAGRDVLGPESRGATVGFSISFTLPSARTDLVATVT